MVGAAAATGAQGSALEAAAEQPDVQQVDYSATPEELQEFFAGCGTVNRVTILCGPGGQPKGYAYIEFAEVEAVVAKMETQQTLMATTTDTMGAMDMMAIGLPCRSRAPLSNMEQGSHYGVCAHCTHRKSDDR